MWLNFFPLLSISLVHMCGPQPQMLVQVFCINTRGTTASSIIIKLGRVENRSESVTVIHSLSGAQEMGFMCSPGPNCCRATDISCCKRQCRPPSREKGWSSMLPKCFRKSPHLGRADSCDYTKNTSMVVILAFSQHEWLFVTSLCA